MRSATASAIDDLGKTTAALEGAVSEVIELAEHCLHKAYTAATASETGAWLRLHYRYLQRYDLADGEVSFGDDILDGLDARAGT